jgi:xanthine dehydrogenase accessory factor
MEMKSIVDLWKRSRERGEEVYLATVVHVHGSSYRKPGARMLVTSGGERAGTISGGCLEAEVSKKIIWLTSKGRVVETYRSSFDDDNEGVPYGLGCGGTLWILMERGAPARAILEAMERALEDYESSVVISDLHTNALSGTVVAGVAESLTQLASKFSESTIRAAKHALSSRTSVGVGDSDGRELPAFLCMPLLPPIHLHIFGAGDDAQPLCRMASELGWHITVADGRTHLLRKDRFPAARELKLLRYSNPAPDGDTLQRHLISEPAIKPSDFAVILTHSYEQDRALLQALLPRSIHYLGILGPLHRTRHLVRSISPLIGLPEEECLAKLHAPVGIRIGSTDPASVALSILAEMQAEYSRHALRPTSYVRSAEAVAM